MKHAVMDDTLLDETTRLRTEVADLQVRLAVRDSEVARWRQQYLTVHSLWTSLQQSWIWRLTSPLRLLRRWLAPRGLDERSLMAWQELQQLGPDTWRSHGPDPQFLVPCMLPAGWLRLQLRLTSSVAGRIELFADYGNGFHASECLERIDGRGDVAVDRLLYLPRPVRAIRLDPLDAPGEFRLERLRLQPLSLISSLRQALLGCGLRFEPGEPCRVSGRVVSQPGRLRGTARHPIEPGPKPGLQRVRSHLNERPLVSIIIACVGRPTRIRGTSEYHLARCLTSIRECSSYDNFEIVVAHGEDMPEDLAAVVRAEARPVVCHEPANRAALWNLGAAGARGSQIVFLHEDVEILTPDWLETLLELAVQTDIGVVGAKLVPHNGSAVSGACLMTSAELFRRITGFTEELGLSYADVDYCLKVRAQGQRVVFTPHAELRQDAAQVQARTYVQELETLQRRWQQHRL